MLANTSEVSGRFFFFQGQGIAREFKKMLGILKFCKIDVNRQGIFTWCQGKRTIPDIAISHAYIDICHICAEEDSTFAFTMKYI